MTIDQAEIARITGLSRQTVSLAVNHPEKLRHDTLEKITAVMKETGYFPNQSARNFKQGKSFTIGMVFRILSDQSYMRPFLAQTLKGLHEEAAVFGYGVRFQVIKDTSEIEPLLRSRSVDGVICGTFLAERDKPLFLSLQKSGLPFVLNSYDESFPGVEMDHAQGFNQGTRRLISSGRRRLAYLGGGLDQEFNRRKFDGFRQALGESGLPLNPSLIRHDCWTMEHGVFAVQDLVKNGLDCDGILAADGDLLALGVLNELRRAGVRVPEQVSLVAADGSLYTQCSDPVLSSVVAPYEERARHSVRMLVDILSGGQGPRFILLPMGFQEGSSL